MSIGEFQDDLNTALHSDNCFAKLLANLETSTGVRRLYLFYGIASFITLWLIFGYGGGLLCFLIGFTYPAYQSIKAIESGNKEDDTQWLTYWVVFTAFSAVEFVSDTLVYWFPLYWFVKCLFLVWCFAPVPWNGSKLMYHRVIRPQFLAHHGNVDAMIAKASANAKELVDQATKLTKGAAANAGVKSD